MAALPLDVLKKTVVQYEKAFGASLLVLVLAVILITLLLPDQSKCLVLPLVVGIVGSIVNWGLILITKRQIVTEENRP